MDTSILRALRAHAITRTLEADDLNYLAGLSRALCYLPGTYVFRESQPRRSFGIIVKGRMEIRKGIRGRPELLAIFGPGESFGEGTFLEDYPHSTSAYVADPLEVVEIPRESITRIAQERPALYARLIIGAAQIIASRLRSASARLAGRERIYLPGELRSERDLLGERDIPDRNYYGIQTLRAVENFPITGIPIAQYPDLIRGLVAVKEAAAMANRDLGLLEPRIAEAIIAACAEIRAGNLHNQFVVDVIQGGAGTSTNMNANEVIANRALELLGHARGAYEIVHPNNHVNLSQSTNDAYPTAIKIAAHASLGGLKLALAELRDAFLAKGDEFADVVKMGRTQLQDAVPMTLGQEFRAFGVTLGEELDHLDHAAALTLEINLGATAVGTGINTDPRYARLVRDHLAAVIGLELRTSPDLVEATQDTGVFVQLSSALKGTALKLSKICNDLRLLSSGPRTGLAEIALPPMQPGSSIMPGKVNPVIPEAVNQVCYQVAGNDLTVALAAEAGQLQLNAFEPVIAFNLFQSIDMLAQACVVLRERCVVGITANRDRIRRDLKASIGTVTALVPFIGYERATAIAREALETERGVYDLILEKAWLTRAELDELLSPDAMTRPRPMPVLRSWADGQAETPGPPRPPAPPAPPETADAPADADGDGGPA